MFSVLLVLLVLSWLQQRSHATFGMLRPLVFPAEVRRLEKLQNTVDYANYFGYEMETHTVTTDDGYQLDIHRLATPGGLPILVMHGLTASSLSWLALGPQTPALPYLLHQHGYDVWLGNTRGTPYGRRHKTLKPTKNGEFWRFSFHEIGLYDLPAIIDYILSETEREQLSYIGHSQGTTIFFVMAALLPSYSEKVNVMHALSPAVFLSHLRSPFVPMFMNAFKRLRYPYLGIFDLRLTNFQQICLSSYFGYNTCLHTIGQFVGDDLENLNKTMLPVYLQHFPLATSIHQLLHFAQNYRTGQFGTLDVDYVRSRKLKSVAYPLGNITTPIALYYAKNDFLVDVRDVNILKTKLSNVVEDYVVPNVKWNHVDFVLGLDAYKVLYAHILKVQQLYDVVESETENATEELEEVDVEDVIEDVGIDEDD